MSDLPFDPSVNPPEGDVPDFTEAIKSLADFPLDERPAPALAQLPDGEARLLDPNERPVPWAHYVHWEKKDWAVAKSCTLTENEYILLEVERTEVYASRFNIQDKRLTKKGTYEPVPVKIRLDKSAAYARWRYRGYLAGEVSSL